MEQLSEFMIIVLDFDKMKWQAVNPLHISRYF